MQIAARLAVLGAMQQEKRLDVIANNIASAGVAGFRADDLKVSGFAEALTFARMEPGPVRETGVPLDVAIEGEGFFQVQTPQGLRYTRAGNFTLNAEGVLVTQGGHPVLGEGAPLTIERGTVRITEDGEVLDGADPVGRLTVTRFPAGTRMVKAEDGLLVPEDPRREPETAEEARLRQGALEGANVNVVQEMTRMIASLRAFEACQKVLASAREEDSQLVQKLGDA